MTLQFQQDYHFSPEGNYPFCLEFMQKVMAIIPTRLSRGVTLMEKHTEHSALSQFNLNWVSQGELACQGNILLQLLFRQHVRHPIKQWNACASTMSTTLPSKNLKGFFPLNYLAFIGLYLVLLKSIRKNVAIEFDRIRPTIRNVSG